MKKLFGLMSLIAIMVATFTLQVNAEVVGNDNPIVVVDVGNDSPTIVSVVESNAENYAYVEKGEAESYASFDADLVFRYLRSTKILVKVDNWNSKEPDIKSSNYLSYSNSINGNVNRYSDAPIVIPLKN